MQSFSCVNLTDVTPFFTTLVTIFVLSQTYQLETNTLTLFSRACVDKSHPILSATHTSLESIIHGQFSCHLVGTVDRPTCGAKPAMHKAKPALEGGRSWESVMFNALMTPCISHSPAERQSQCSSRENGRAGKGRVRGPVNPGLRG